MLPSVDTTPLLLVPGFGSTIAVQTYSAMSGSLDATQSRKRLLHKSLYCAVVTKQALVSYVYQANAKVTAKSVVWRNCILLYANVFQQTKVIETGTSHYQS